MYELLLCIVWDLKPRKPTKKKSQQTKIEALSLGQKSQGTCNDFRINVLIMFLAPNAYSLPTTVGANCVDKSSAPSYGVRSRPNQGGFSEDLQKVFT